MSEIWQKIVAEVKALSVAEPMLSSFFHATVLNHDHLASALSYQLSAKLDAKDLPGLLLREVIEEALAADVSIIQAVEADIEAVYRRDPACEKYAVPLLYFKGFLALQAHRVAHWLWQQQRHCLAYYFQNRNASVFAVDIHPGAKIGAGIMLDHATSLVIGETVVIGNNVSLLHSVTLGGSSRAGEFDRHPKIGDGVMISTGAKVLGNVEIGQGVKIAAGSVVLNSVPAHTTVAGVPAVAVGQPRALSPSLNMDQQLSD